MSMATAFLGCIEYKKGVIICQMSVSMLGAGQRLARVYLRVGRSPIRDNDAEKDCRENYREQEGISCDKRKR
jgi:hypothetical protein